MGRRAGILALVLVAFTSALVTVLAIRDRGAASGPPPAGRSAVTAEATISPRVLLFGDTARAQIDVLVDASRIDPDSVRVAASLEPFEVVGRLDGVRRASGATVLLRTTFVLRCLTSNCVPSGQSARYDFAPARISFAAAGPTVPASPIRARLQSIRVYSRFTPTTSPGDRTAGPWQADLLSLPAVTHRLPPGLLVALLLAGAAVAGAFGLGLAYLAWPPRARRPEPEPEPPPAPLLSPLEQALALLEQSLAADGVPGRRRALELVAEELEHADWGDRHLAGAARALAWSEDQPDLEETRALAARVRSALPEQHDGAAAEGPDGS